MSLKLKWHLKEAGRYLLSVPFSLTAVLLVVIAIRVMRFHRYGLDMYPELSVPKIFAIDWALDQFWTRSLAPLLPFFLMTLPLDVLVRRFGLGLNER